MVIGFDKFRDKFGDFANDYVITAAAPATGSSHIVTLVSGRPRTLISLSVQNELRMPL